MNNPEFTHELPSCDILMQLDNMLEGGLENVVIDLACALEKWGYRVAILVLANAGEGARKALRNGLRVCLLPYSEQALRQELERNRPTIVFAHYSFQGTHLYKGLGIPFIQVLHNVYAWFDDAEKEMFATAVPHTTLFVAVSETVKEYSIEHLHIPSEKCLVIPNGIDLSRFTPHAVQEAQNLRRRMGFSEKDFLFVAVNTLNRFKRILALVKALRCIRELAPHVRLVLLGHPHDKGYLDEILAYVDKNGLQDCVNYAGHSTEPELYYLMANAFAHASSIEGGQLVLLEALAANLAVVTTNVGFARHFAPYPDIRVVGREFPYVYASFANTKAIFPSPTLVGNLAWAMLQTYRSSMRPNLPREVIAAFDVARTYARYEQLIAGILKLSPRTAPTAGWMDLLPESLPYATVPRLSDEGDAATALRTIAEYEALVVERDVALATKDAQLVERDAQIAYIESLRIKILNSRSWRITKPARFLSRIVRKGLSKHDKPKGSSG